MQHVHRQIVSLREWTPAVICQKRENAQAFPFPDKRLSVLAKSKWRWARRMWFRHIRHEPVRISRGRVLELLLEMGRHEADVVHVFFGQIAVQLLPFLQACPRPVVVSFHGADAGVDVENPAFHAALTGVFKAARLVFARSDSLLKELVRLGCPPAKLRLQRTGIPLDAWPVVDRQWPPADGAWKWLQSCRMVAKKGLRTTLAAFREVLPAFPHARLILAGDGPLRGELESLAGEWNVRDRVEFRGFLTQDQLRAAVAEAHFFVHPSETPADGNREGVPNAMLEAMATGLPVLATRHGGIPEAVTHERSGLLVAEGDASALAQSALRLMGDPALCRRMAAEARREVEEKFDRVRQTEVLEGYYAEAMRLPAVASAAASG
jgi:colanic acid/amylovoran biosynthesis glycosyltransferase